MSGPIRDVHTHPLTTGTILHVEPAHQQLRYDGPAKSSLDPKDLTKTQAQISSGLAVANASDNAAYWSIATSMKSDVSALGAVSNALNLGASVLNTATSAMNSVETILKQMKADIVTAQTSGTNATQVQSDISAQQQSLVTIMNSASFNGVNLLDGSKTSTNIVDFLPEFDQNHHHGRPDSPDERHRARRHVDHGRWRSWG